MAIRQVPSGFRFASRVPPSVVGSRIRIVPVALAAALVATLAAAVPAAATTPAVTGRGECVDATNWVRAELVDRHGAPSGQFVDTRCANRTLTARAASRFHYVRHVGQDAPNTGVEITYADATTGLGLHRESTATRRSGRFSTAPVDVMPMLAMSGGLTVNVHHSGLSALQDLAEYGIALALIGRADCQVRGDEPTWVRAELVDRDGVPSGQFVDSRCATRTLTVYLNTRFHYLRHVGLDAPGTGLEITIVDPASTVELHRETMTTAGSGFFVARSTDLASMLRPGATLTAGVHHTPGQPSVLQDLIEYALLAGFVS
jgi:hypothetical protein